MNENRRNFIKQAVIGTGLLLGNSVKAIDLESVKTINESLHTFHKQKFNMCGYRAPKLETVRIGFIGIGNRGIFNMTQMLYIEGIEVKALCDLRQFRIDEAQKLLSDFKNPVACEYGGSPDAWKSVCEQSDIDLIMIAVPRGPLHAKISNYAMLCGKHVAVEVPAIATIDEAWQLVETSEKTKKHCTMLENCCYDFFELLTLNMIRQGLLGTIIHADAAYIHHQNNFVKNRDGDMWRIEESQRHNGNLYPTHGLGPICQAMNINRGDRMTHMVSMSSNDFMMAEMATEFAQKNPIYKYLATDTYRGNMNTSVIRTERGRTIMLQYDTTSPRVYSRIYMVSGTKGAVQKYHFPERISLGDDWVSEKEMENLTEKYMPEIVRRIGNMAKKIGGHGGMDFLMSWRLIDCLRNGLPMDIDVYDAVAWSSIIPLSEWSVKHGSQPVLIPDFTCGSYRLNEPFV